MCGRYNFTAEESAELQEIVRQIEAKNAQAEWHVGEIFPTNTAPVLFWEQEQTSPDLLGWGFPGFKSGARTIINARAETAGERPMFRKSLDERRCVIPSSGFYEWQKLSKQKYLFRLPGEDALYMAGIWNEFAGERRFCIITTEANESIADVHSRMPVVLPKSEINEWLCNRRVAEEILHTVPPMLAREAVSAQTTLW
ncbi:SOS response-associated peptidase [Anaerotruncus rubiinfantis]|uniref:SOS response-associated peptidase n=1 Tax=Anaerotruncus rubiinfantis TaxID=1720200 RepID=UPI00082A266B|nr:SOS response-associated peptidase [Anaerotruncus rubiinfantis]